MANFKIRTQAPTRDNIYYGSNANPYQASGYGMFANGGNCTAYAWGRFHEIMGTTKDPAGTYYCPGNGCDVYPKSTGFKKGKTPQIGAILCWGAFTLNGSYAPGHVSIVEQINADGSVLVSESGWRTMLFRTNTYYPPNYGCQSFQGFLYNPASPGGGMFANPAQAFLDEARKHIGDKGHEWVKSQVPIKSTAWAAATICAIAKVTGIGPAVLPTGRDDTVYWASCEGPGDYAVKQGGERIDGPALGKNIKPRPGDLIIFDWEPKYKSETGTLKSRYVSHCDHVGIVEKVTGFYVHTIEGNASNTYARRAYKFNDSRIVYYVRPNWSRIGGDLVNPYGESEGIMVPLYETSSSNADALIRDVGYLSSKNEVVTSKTDIGVSAINYTYVLGPLSEFMSISSGYSEYSGEHGEIDTSGITNTVARGIADYLAAKGLNRAAIAGVLGNIQNESSFKIDAVELGPPYEGRGIVQWSYKRRERLLKRVPDWRTNLKGQLDLLWWELENEYNSTNRPVLRTLQSVPDTPDGCYEATKVFVMRFEVPQGYDQKWQWDKRYASAKPFYDKMKVKSSITSSASNALSAVSKIANNSGVSSVNHYNHQTPIKTVRIPTNVAQTGVISDYTPYNKISWAWDCKTVYDMWVSRGRKVDHSIAVIDGNYLIALQNGTFGNVGDIVRVTLEGGITFNAIIADTKRKTDSNSGSWGHVYSGKVSVIEWEAVLNKQEELNKGLKDLGWYYKKVLQVDNYGKYGK